MARVILIDDEEEILKTLKSHLLLAGISAETSQSSKKAVEWHQAEPFDVVVTDIRMPEMTGLQVIEAVKQTSPRTSVFVITGYATLSNLADCLERGATDYFMKPFKRIDDVVATIKDAAERQDRWSQDLAKVKKAS